ncbi:MAG: flavin-containing monooxygenase, partial [Algiphilus sp.]
PWIMSKPDRRISGLEQRMFRFLPPAQRLMRSSIYWWMESRVLGLAVDPRAMKLAELMARRHIRKSIKDPALRAQVTPDYTIGCKRILMSDDYYPALTRANVTVNTDGVERVHADSITDGAGRNHPVDTIIYGTGFQVSDPIGPMSVVGSDGREIRESWKEGGMEAYLGISVAGFPNFFMLLGPNTGLGHSSIIFMIESQVAYVLQAIKHIRRRPRQALDVTAMAQRQFNDRLQAQLDKAVWSSGGCNSWYLDEYGKNRTLWPSFTFRYWLRTRRFEPDKYATV